MPLVASRILNEYRKKTTKSGELAAQARGIFPSGVTHDSRYLEPYPLFIDRAAGSRKWDVDGNEYVDYSGGHGALLLGHNHPAVLAALERQLLRGTHYGACHELEIEWGEWVQRLIPSAERVRFTSSGTEATLLAMRLVRAFTGRKKIVRFLANFHGWQDHVAFGVSSHLDGTATPGVLDEIADNALLVPPGDLAAVERLLAARQDIAAVMLEPTGASWGQIPVSPEFVRDLRTLCTERDVLLVFDEVITGFRCAPGGAQGALGVLPDVTTLAKIVAGGLPGGAVCGRRDILDWLDHAASTAARREKVGHQGTFNANPLSAAAGIATLALLAETDVCHRANDYAARLRAEMQQEVERAGLDWCIYGSYSGFHIFTNPAHDSVTPADIEAGKYDWRKLKAQSQRTELLTKLRLGMILCGVELFSWPGGPTSAVHSDLDLQHTVTAFAETLTMLREDGCL